MTEGEDQATEQPGDDRGVRAALRAHADQPPAQELVSSLRLDLRVKRRIYAAAGVREYWVVDVAHRKVHVHRELQGGDYTQVTVHGPEASLALLAFPDVVVPCAELLPDLTT